MKLSIFSVNFWEAQCAVCGETLAEKRGNKNTAKSINY